MSDQTLDKRVEKAVSWLDKEIEQTEGAGCDEYCLGHLGKCMSAKRAMLDLSAAFKGEQEKNIVLVEDSFDVERFQQAPCYICGYNGQGYYQPASHACAKFYHKKTEAKIDASLALAKAIVSGGRGHGWHY